MPTVDQILHELKKKANEQTRRTYERHGADPGRMYGVKVADMKAIARRIKGEHELACELYDSGNLDAQYLAGMVADGRRMTRKQLDGWARDAAWQMVSEYTVPWVASESEHGRSLALKWIGRKKEHVAAAGWNTYSGIVATTPDDRLDQKEIRALLGRIEREIGGAPNRVKYTMNGFVMAVGAYCAPLATAARATARKLGKVEVDMGGTACKVPDALEAIEKIASMGRLGRKRKTIRC